jgi:hypothetical protein
LGVGQGDHVGILAYSRPEYLETMVASYKVRAVPINVNYRYVARELAYLFDNADLVALVLEASFAPLMASLREEVPRLAHLLVVDDGSSEASALPDAVSYEDLLAAHAPVRDFGARSGDDAYIAYTGGTTGYPKGVVWRQEDIFFATMTPGVGVERPEAAPGRAGRGGGGGARRLRVLRAGPAHARERALVCVGRVAGGRVRRAASEPQDGSPHRPRSRGARARDHAHHRRRLHGPAPGGGD